MRFYKLDKDPKKSSRLLPHVVLKQDNAPMGMFILKDIATLYGLNLEDIPSKGSVLQQDIIEHIQDKEVYFDLINHYEANLKEYKLRSRNENFKEFILSDYSKYVNFFNSYLALHQVIVDSLPDNKFRKQAKEIILTYKLSPQEKVRMENI